MAAIFRRSQCLNLQHVSTSSSDTTKKSCMRLVTSLQKVSGVALDQPSVVALEPRRICFPVFPPCRADVTLLCSFASHLCLLAFTSWLLVTWCGLTAGIRLLNMRLWPACKLCWCVRSRPGCWCRLQIQFEIHVHHWQFWNHCITGENMHVLLGMLWRSNVSDTRVSHSYCCCYCCSQIPACTARQTLADINQLWSHTLPITPWA